MNFLSDGAARAGTAGGTLAVILLQISNGEVLKTVVLAALGAVVSFGTSMLLKAVIRKVRRAKREDKVNG
jgi:Na+-translocating ferredoxin:NAD+ oxidoreductase RnfA subunit